MNYIQILLSISGGLEGSCFFTPDGNSSYCICPIGHAGVEFNKTCDIECYHGGYCDLLEDKRFFPSFYDCVQCENLIEQCEDVSGYEGRTPPRMSGGMFAFVVIFGLLVFVTLL